MPASHGGVALATLSRVTAVVVQGCGENTFLYSFFNIGTKSSPVNDYYHIAGKLLLLPTLTGSCTALFTEHTCMLRQYVCGQCLTFFTDWLSSAVRMVRIKRKALRYRLIYAISRGSLAQQNQGMPTWRQITYSAIRYTSAPYAIT